MTADHEQPKPEPVADAGSFQSRVQPWMMACFGPEISADRLERNDRFLEEALELVQASGYTKDRIYALVEYVYGRPQGEINQEVGGVMVTLAAHCLAHSIDMHEAGETELARIWTKVEQIRAKQAAKPTGSALPVAEPLADAGGVVEARYPVEGCRDDLVERAEVIRILRTLGETHADLALGGEPDNARSREAAEAAFTNARCAVALMPAASLAPRAEAPANQPRPEELTPAERYELECLRHQVKQLDYPCSPHCAGYLREQELRNTLAHGGFIA